MGKYSGSISNNIMAVLVWYLFRVPKTHHALVVAQHQHASHVNGHRS
jgi:hypothetical protein